MVFRLQAPPGWQSGHVKSAIDAEFHPEDVLVALHGRGDLDRRDFSDDFREVTLIGSKRLIWDEIPAGDPHRGQGVVGRGRARRPADQLGRTR